jgi:hypothetical protein
MKATRALLLGVVGLMVSGTALAEEAVNTCISCHAEDEDEELSAPVEEWRRSTHAEVEVSCDACHGGDPLESDEELSMSEDDAGYIGAPSWHEVPEFCGSCHEKILEGYQQSVMAAQIESGERVAVCTTCHMSDGHAITRIVPSEVLTAERCGQCHDPQRAFDLLEALDSTSKDVEVAQKLISELHGRIDTGRLDRELAEIVDRYLVVAHTYDVERLAEVAEVCSARVDALSETAAALTEELHFRRRLGGAVIGFFTFVCLGALRLERDLRRRGK